jgi:hypothetical protein
LRRWLFRLANHSQWSWIQILNTTWQVTNQNAANSAWVTMVITRGVKRRTITWTAGGVFLIWQQPITARDFRSALILAGCRDVGYVASMLAEWWPPWSQPHCAAVISLQQTSRRSYRLIDGYPRKATTELVEKERLQLPPVSCNAWVPVAFSPCHLACHTNEGFK